MKEFRHRTCIICDEMHGRRYMCGPCWCRVWNKFDVGILESHPKASESSRDQSIRDMMADRPCWNVVDTYRQEIDKFNSVKGVKYNKRVLFNMFKRSGLTYDEALIIHTLGALDD